jgi:DNA-3-methyladenine glycosylase
MAEPGNSLSRESLETQAIAQDWFARPSPEVAPDLLGCVLVRQLPDGAQVRGLIVEAEAYAPGDPACHAYRRRTPRNAVMFGPAGMTYVYLIYGMYHCLNIVTDVDGAPSAVLLRAVQLLHLPAHLEPPLPRSRSRPPKNWRDRLAAGPGKLCRVLQIDRSLSATALHPAHPLWVEHRPDFVSEQIRQNQFSLVQTQRIGISEGTELPWRWYVKDCPAVSKK